MDCQSYTYARLDSLDPEVYKKSENTSDVKILMEGGQALLEPTKDVIKSKKEVKKIKKRKSVLSTLDIFISIFIITPCVVGCWRGLWHVMDFYAFYFPEWESFSIGMAAHIILALGQDVFHYVIVEKESKNSIMKMLSLFVMKFYLVTFYLITILTWRGGWIIFDRYCQLKFSSSGAILLEGSSTANWFTLVCILILLCLKGLKNTLAPPFSIALDLKDEVFLFSTRYIYKAKAEIEVESKMRGSTAGLPENFQGYNSRYYKFLTVVDSLFAALVVCPCVVGYWRSVWNIMDQHVIPENELLSAVISTAIGVCGHIIFLLFQKVFEHNFHPDKNRILYYLVSRSYTVCFAFTCVNGWRGPWQLLDIQSKTNVYAVLATTLVGVVALISIRGLRNVSAPPCLIVNDGVKGYFEVMTMFRISIGEKTSLYILDCLFSVLIVGTLVVFVWRGAWVLIDILLFPGNEVLSAWGSLIIGYTSVAVAFLLQPVMRYLCERFSGTPRLLIADFFILFALFGTVNVWRGIWNMLNIYFLPDQPELSCWITHWVCLIALILLGCSNSLLVRGVYIDAEEPAGKCVVFPCYYLRIIFQGEKRKELNLTSLSFDQQVKVNKRDSEKIVENNHAVSASTISSTIEENHKENFQ